MGKCRVLELVSSLDDGGAETLVRTYAELINKDEFEVAIVTIHNYHNSANYAESRKKKLTTISVFKHYNIVSRLAFKLFGKWLVPHRLKRIIFDYSADVIHVHLSLLKYLQPISQELKGIRIFYTCHNEPRRMLMPGSDEFEAARFLIDYNQLQLIALHGEMKRELDLMFNTTTTEVVRNGIDMVKFRSPMVPRDGVRAKLGIKKNAFVIGHIGRLEQQKNHRFLIEVFYELYRQNSDAFLLLVGSGSLEKEIRKQISSLGIEKCTCILSHRSDIPELLSAMDVFLFPSFYEGLSVTLVEAQAARIRCVVSDQINSETILSENTIPLSLKDSISKWCQVVNDSSIKNLHYGDIKKFDMRNEIIHLEKMYLGSENR